MRKQVQYEFHFKHGVARLLFFLHDPGHPSTFRLGLLDSNRLWTWFCEIMKAGMIPRRVHSTLAGVGGRLRKALTKWMKRNFERTSRALRESPLPPFIDDVNASRLITRMCQSIGHSLAFLNKHLCNLSLNIISCYVHRMSRRRRRRNAVVDCGAVLRN